MIQGEPEKGNDAKAISVEVVVSKDRAKEIGAAKRFMAVGGVSFAEDNCSVIAENLFVLDGVEDAEGQFRAEVEGCRELLCSKVVQNEKKRPAKDLIDETPSKKLCNVVLLAGA